MAYADYNDLMEMTEEMLSEMVKKITGGTVITFHPDENDKSKVRTVDFSRPFKRVPMM